jgi:hypothetical protein
VKRKRTVRTVATVGCVLVAFIYVAEWREATTSASIGVTETPYWSIDNASPPVQKQIRELASQYKVDFDTRNRIDVIAEMRERHLNPVPVVRIGSLLAERSAGTSIVPDKLLPFGGISSSLTVLCNESGKYITFRSDVHGFRNPPGMWNHDQADLAVVGESLAQGYCVPDGKSFVDLLRPAYPVTLNLGASGESALIQLAAIREYLPRFRPKIVLWIYSEDVDIGDLIDETKQPLLMHYLDPDFSQNLISRQSEIDRTLRRLIADDDASRRRGGQEPVKEGIDIKTVLSILKLWHLRDMLAAVRATDEAQTLDTLQKWHEYPYREIIQQAHALTQSWGGTLYFVYLPSWRRYRHHAAATELEHTTMLRMIQSLNIRYIDVQPAFEATSDPLSFFPFRRFGHYNEDGNKLVSDTILHALETARRIDAAAPATQNKVVNRLSHGEP